MTEKPKPGTYGALTRSTEEEHQAFMKALKGLYFTREEFLTHGPAIVFMKFDEVMKRLKEIQ